MITNECPCTVFCRAGGSHVQTEIKQPLLLVVCPLFKIEEIANQESESSSLPHAEYLFRLQFSSVSDYYDHIIRCHPSLPGIQRARFAKVTQCCRANNAPMARLFAVGNARRVEKHVPRRGSEGRKTQGWNLCCPKSVIESQKERIWRPDDGNGLSKYRKWCCWLRENTAESMMQCAQPRRLLEGFLCRTWLVEGDVASLQSFAAAKAQAHSEAGRGQKWHQMGATLHVGVCSVRQWPGDGESWRDRAGGSRGGMAEPIPQTAHLGIGYGPVSGDVEHSRDPPETGTSADTVEIPDAPARPCSSGGCAEQQQAGTHSPQSPPPSKGDRTGRPGRHHRRTRSEIILSQLGHRRKRAEGKYI